MGAPKWPQAAMRTLPLAPSVGLLWGHSPREGCAKMARGRRTNPAIGAFGGWSSLWGHEALDWVSEWRHF
eukprot:4453653-Pyramimonas_sp.AAC.1